MFFNQIIFATKSEECLLGNFKVKREDLTKEIINAKKKVEGKKFLKYFDRLYNFRIVIEDDSGNKYSNYENIFSFYSQRFFLFYKPREKNILLSNHSDLYKECLQKMNNINYTDKYKITIKIEDVSWKMYLKIVFYNIVELLKKAFFIYTFYCFLKGIIAFFKYYKNFSKKNKVDNIITKNIQYQKIETEKQMKNLKKQNKKPRKIKEKIQKNNKLSKTNKKKK